MSLNARSRPCPRRQATSRLQDTLSSLSLHQARNLGQRRQTLTLPASVTCVRHATAHLMVSWGSMSADDPGKQIGSVIQSSYSTRSNAELAGAAVLFHT